MPSRRPTALKALLGTARPDRANAAEPVLPVRATRYPAPKWLGAEAREEWDRLEGGLRAAGILTEADLAAFAHYCAAFGEARWANGQAVKAKTAKARAYWSGFSRKNWEAMSKAAQQLGLTPAARGKVRVEKPAEVDPLAHFMLPANRG